MKTIEDIIKNNHYKIMTNTKTATRSFLGCYQSDLLSRVIKQTEPDMLLLTIINHINTVATATMCDLSGIILCEGQQPTKTMIDRANEEHIAIVCTDLKSHEVVIDLFQRGLI
jgi:serine kinase of HPr protein (carbohydrate metabolism regulator)